MLQAPISCSFWWIATTFPNCSRISLQGFLFLKGMVIMCPVEEAVCYISGFHLLPWNSSKKNETRYFCRHGVFKTFDIEDSRCKNQQLSLSNLTGEGCAQHPVFLVELWYNLIRSRGWRGLFNYWARPLVLVAVWSLRHLSKAGF